MKKVRNACATKRAESSTQHGGTAWDHIPRRPRLSRIAEHLHHVLLERVLPLPRNPDTNLQHETNPSEIRAVVAMQLAVVACCGEHHHGHLIFAVVLQAVFARTLSPMLLWNSG
jgi:hypothetical protein